MNTRARLNALIANALGPIIGALKSDARVPFQARRAIDRGDYVGAVEAMINNNLSMFNRLINLTRAKHGNTSVVVVNSGGKQLVVRLATTSGKPLVTFGQLVALANRYPASLARSFAELGLGTLVFNVTAAFNTFFNLTQNVARGVSQGAQNIARTLRLPFAFGNYEPAAELEESDVWVSEGSLGDAGLTAGGAVAAGGTTAATGGTVAVMLALAETLGPPVIEQIGQMVTGLLTQGPSSPASLRSPRSTATFNAPQQGKSSGSGQKAKDNAPQAQQQQGVPGYVWGIAVAALAVMWTTRNPK